MLQIWNCFCERNYQNRLLILDVSPQFKGTARYVDTGRAEYFDFVGGAGTGHAGKLFPLRGVCGGDELRGLSHGGLFHRSKSVRASSSKRND